MRYDLILEEATKEAFGYWPRDLKAQSNKPILAACDECGKLRETSKDNYCALCKSCAKKCRIWTEEQKARMSAATKGEKNPNFGHKGEKASNWKGGPVKSICQECGKEFAVKQYRIKRGKGKYCSQSCASTANIKIQRHNARPVMTTPEKAFESICKKYILPFKFVGDGALWIGHANPDFVHNTKKIAVEVFGDYFHFPLLNSKLRYTATVKGRMDQLKSEGYKTIIIWESDLKREDAEKFIMHTLHKEGVI